MSNKSGKITIIIEKGKHRMKVSAPLTGIKRYVFVINRQFTNAPNTTQISSGAGRSSASGSNAAINSPYTNQQQSVGAGGTARNKSIRESRNYRNARARVLTKRNGKEIIVVLNDQVVKFPRGQQNASATQVASGAGRYSTGGTNSAIGSPSTKQQHAVGGGGTALNKRVNKRRRTKRR